MRLQYPSAAAGSGYIRSPIKPVIWLPERSDGAGRKGGKSSLAAGGPGKRAATAKAGRDVCAICNRGERGDMVCDCDSGYPGVREGKQEEKDGQSLGRWEEYWAHLE